ncbi:MAG: CCA tRNA nucleotidyltransferase [Candidatus Limnocylindria bacterium]
MAAPDREVAYRDLPDTVRRVLATLIDAGHEVVLVGGCVRDRLLDAPHDSWDWDAATSAAPEEVEALFPHTTWENRFGTVTVRGTPPVEVTSFRTEGAYRDARRPSEVRFGSTLRDDLARRDFTINAIAWVPVEVDADAARGTLVDPFGGVADLQGRLLRTVGEPRERFAEDALRLIRAARFAGRFDMTLDPVTEAAILELAPTVASVSAERVRDELVRILGLDPTPSRALRLLERLGLLLVVLPELAALRGIPQDKSVRGDALDHTLAAVDAAPQIVPLDARLATLLHDIGKATTMAGGHFIGHEQVGAEMATRVLARLRVPRWRVDRVAAAIRQHMYQYDGSWTDAAVRRFIRRTDGVDRDLLFTLRRADNAASGVAAEGERDQDELERRIADEIERQPGLLVDRRLAIDGHDLQRELGLAPGPRVGRVLDGLVEAVLEDPSRNEREELLSLARNLADQR